MSSGDPRKSYLANVIMDQLLGGKDDQAMFEQLCNGPEMDDFLDQSAGDRPLQAALIKSPGGRPDIRLSNKVQSSDEESSVCFTKVGTASITPENIQRTIQITSAPRSAVDGLYSSLHNVFIPLLRQNGKLDKEISALLEDLDASLGSVVRGSRGGNQLAEKQHVIGILKLEDEIAFWEDMSDGDGTNRDCCAALRQIAKYLALDDADAENGSDVQREAMWAALENSELVLDGLLRKLEYPEIRMSHLLKLIGDKVIQFIQRSLAADAPSGRDVWSSSLADADRELSSSIALCEHWGKLTDSLVRAWHDDRMWRSDFKDKRLGELLERLRTLLDLRRTQDALQTLLDRDQQQELRISEQFQRFGAARALQVNAYSKAAWEGAMSDYNLAMDAAIVKVSEKLQIQFAQKLLPDVEAVSR